MSRRNVVSFYTAPARSGKTFRMVVRICDEILPLGDGVIYTNLPLNCERIAEYCEEKHGLNREDVLNRLQIIPRDVEDAWKDAGRENFAANGRRMGIHPVTGPWEYFSDKALSGSTIIIDEIHNFCGSIGTPRAISNQWQKWLGELGHNQAIFICISQAPEKVHTCIKQEAQAAYTIRNTGLDRDPYFGIEVYDWLELTSGLFGWEYKVFVFEQEIQKIEGRRKRGQRKLCLMGPPYFDFYDSFNKPIDSKQTANVAAFEHEYEKYLRKGIILGRLSLVRWFAFKNIQPLVSRGFLGVAALALMYFMLTGGMGEVSQYLSKSLTLKGKNAHANEAVKESVKPPENPIEAEIAKVRPEPPKTVTTEEQAKLDMVKKLYEDELRKALTAAQEAKTEILAAKIAQEKLNTELDKVKEEMERQSALVLITPTGIVMQRGRSYEIGDTIATGKYKGKKLVSINYPLREAVLDDGVVLGLGD